MSQPDCRGEIPWHRVAADGDGPTVAAARRGRLPASSAGGTRMSQLTCGGCGSVYPMAGVQALDTFTCSVCQRVIVVPIAGPSAARAAQAKPAPARPAAPPPPPPVPAAPAPRTAPAVRRAAEPPPIPGAAPAPARAHVERERVGEPRLMKPVGGLGNGVTAMFVALILAAFADIYFRWTTVLFLGDIRPGVAPDMDRARAIDAATTSAAIAYLVAVAVLAIVFCAWFHRAHSNLRAARLPKIEYGSGWAIGGFFVPLLNLVRPAQVMKETWAGTSYLSGTSHVSAWKRSPANPLVSWWWGLFLASSILGNVGGMLTRGGSAGVSAATTLSWIWIGSRLVGIASALVGISLVRRISELQDWARRRE